MYVQSVQPLQLWKQLHSGLQRVLFRDVDCHDNKRDICLRIINQYEDEDFSVPEILALQLGLLGLPVLYKRLKKNVKAANVSEINGEYNTWQCRSCYPTVSTTNSASPLCPNPVCIGLLHYVTLNSSGLFKRQLLHWLGGCVRWHAYIWHEHHCGTYIKHYHAPPRMGYVCCRK